MGACESSHSALPRLRPEALPLPPRVIGHPGGGGAAGGLAVVYMCCACAHACALVQPNHFHKSPFSWFVGSLESRSEI